MTEEILKELLALSKEQGMRALAVAIGEYLATVEGASEVKLGIMRVVNETLSKEVTN